MTGAEVARAVRLRRLVVWRLGYEQFQLVLKYCRTRPHIYTRTEWRGRVAVVAGDSLYIEGR